MWGEERETQGEVGARKDGESLDEDVGDGLVTGEVWVELVAAVPWLVRCKADSGGTIAMARESCQIELIINFSGWGDSFPIPRVIGNVVVVSSSCSIGRRVGGKTYSFNRARLA